MNLGRLELHKYARTSANIRIHLYIVRLAIGRESVDVIVREWHGLFDRVGLLP